MTIHEIIAELQRMVAVAALTDAKVSVVALVNVEGRGVCLLDNTEGRHVEIVAMWQKLLTQ